MDLLAHTGDLPIPPDGASRELILAVLTVGNYRPEPDVSFPVIPGTVLRDLIRGAYGPLKERRIKVNGVTFTGDVDLAYCDWRGELDLTYCVIQGTLELSHARIGGTVKIDKMHVGEVDARYAVIDGAFLFRNARCAWGFYGLATTIHGSLNMRGTEIWAPWNHPNRCAIELFRAQVGDVFLTRSNVHGGIYGNGLDVGRNVRLQGAHVAGRSEMGWETGPDSAKAAITLVGATIENGLYLSWETPSDKNTSLRINGLVTLGRATCRSFHVSYSDLAGLRLAINHFEYARLVKLTAQEWLSAIDSTPNASGQPYIRLAALCAELGRTDLRRGVLVALQRRITSDLPKGWEQSRRRLWDWSVAYGYAPGRAILWLLLCAVVSVAVLRLGGYFLIHDGVPATRGVGRLTEAVTLAADNLLPFAGLGAARHWSANPKNAVECAWMIGFVMLKFLAWSLAGLGLASVTGVARRE